MKTISKVVMALLLIVGLTQCQPEDKIGPNAGDGEKVSFTIRANGGAKATKTEITQNGEYLNVTWSAGDVIYVAGSTQGYLGSLTLQSGAGTNIATFGGEITATTSTQNIHVYYLGKTSRTITANATTIDIGTQAGTLNDIENYHIASATILDVPAGSNDLNATFESKIAIVKFDLSTFISNPILYGVGVYKSLSLNLLTGNLTGSTQATYHDPIQINNHTSEAYVAMLPGNDISMNFYDGSKPCELLNKTLNSNLFYSNKGTGIAPVSSVPEGAVSGLFSVSATKQVYFSKGNLQYQASSKTWQFAANQYDYIGQATGNNTSADDRPTQSAWIDLFGWGTSGFNNGNIYYNPWDCEALDEYDDDNNCNDVIGFGYGPLVGGILSDLTGNYDWGYNPISNGGNTGQQWRTLSAGEWDYLISRTGGLKCLATITVGGDDKPCFILLPDGFTQPSTWDVYPNTDCITFFDNINFDDQEHTGATIIPLSKWNEIGAVILPAPGYRELPEFGGAAPSLSSTSAGYYWTSSVNETSTNYGASYFAFEDSGESTDFVIGVDVDCSAENHPYMGYSVRLVKDK